MCNIISNISEHIKETFLFSKQLRQLLKGESVIIPTYNFIAGIKEYKRKPTTLKENRVLIYHK